MANYRVVGIYNSEEEVIHQLSAFQSKGEPINNFAYISNFQSSLLERNGIYPLNSTSTSSSFAQFVADLGRSLGTIVTPTFGGGISSHTNAGLFYTGPIGNTYRNEADLGDLYTNLSQEYVEELERGKIILLRKETFAL